MKNYSRNSGLLYLHPAVTVVMLTFFGIAAYMIWSISKPVDQEEATPIAKSTPPVEAGPGSESVQQVQTTAGEVMKPPRPDVEDTVLSDVRRMVPGEVATEWLYYRSKEAKNVQIAGAWDGWSTKTDMIPASKGLWASPIAKVDAPFGSYEFKFILDGEWEGGANRLLHLNEEGLMEAPPKVVSQTLIEHPHQLRILLLTAPKDTAAVHVSLEPDHGELKLRWKVPEQNANLTGFRVVEEDVEFVMEPSSYSLSPDAIHSVAVAGTFNSWNPSDSNSQLTRQPDGSWTGRLSYGFIDSNTTGPDLLFKFVVNGDEWQNPPEGAPNAMLEPGTPHMNLSLPRHGAARPELLVQTRNPIDLRSPPIVTIEGLHEKKLRLHPTPGAIMDTLYSDLPMGVAFDRETPATIYRLFAPRAAKVQLGLFEGPYHTTPDDDPVEPSETIDMTRIEDGVWEHRQKGLHIGQYYAFRVEGPQRNGEGFNPNRWLGDPYAKAVALAEGNSIVVDLEATKAPWNGWSEAARSLRIPWEDQVIYETHVRHFTMDESSGVQADLRGGYLGILATEGLGTGLDHLKSLGVNVIQFMPIHEFPNGFEGRHDWGYATDFFFAPESSFAQHTR
ncbi:MAG: hypothetical protein PF795_07610, partial [Kiritimatiellae bacterium]|nr:hypothetical protein [Kiritimatiellia bacterium]